MIYNTVKPVSRYTEISKDEDIHDLLSEIAVVNVKKSSGRSNSKMNEVNVYAEYDKEKLREQIEILEPNIIVCSYTIKAPNTIFGTDKKD